MGNVFVIKNRHNQSNRANQTVSSSLTRARENLNLAIDTARRIVLETPLEHLEHVPTEIWIPNTSGNLHWDGYSDLFGYFGKGYVESEHTIR